MNMLSRIFKPLKLIKIGNSVGVILSKDVLAKLRVSQGETLYLSETPAGYMLSATNPEFVDAMSKAEEIMREDRDILAVLAK